MSPICIPCGLMMRCIKNGVWVKDPRVGEAESTYWKADLYRCDKCQAIIATGFSDLGLQESQFQVLSLDLPTEVYGFAYQTAKTKQFLDDFLEDVARAGLTLVTKRDRITIESEDES